MYFPVTYVRGGGAGGGGEVKLHLGQILPPTPFYQIQLTKGFDLKNDPPFHLCKDLVKFHQLFWRLL